MPRQTNIQIRRGTASDWTSVNPTLDAGEIAMETDTKKLKVGDGSTAWNSLKYIGLDGGSLDGDVTTTTLAPTTTTPAPPPAGLLFAAGNDSYSRLPGSRNNSAFVQIGSASWRMVRTSALGGHAIKSDGTLWGWGSQDFYEIGDGTNTTRISPVQVGTSTWLTVSRSGYGQTVLAIRSDNKLFGWGNNGSSELGLGDTTFRSTPAQVGSDSWIAVSTSDNGHSLAIRSDGKLFGTGLNNYGQLGEDTSTTGRSSFTQIGSSSWVAVAAGDGFSLAIRSDGKLFSWGKNAQKQLGLSDTDDRTTPTQVGSSDWIAVSACGDAAAAIRADGKLFAWGESEISTPTQVGTDSWLDVAVGRTNKVAIRSDKKLFVWGANDQYQLATGNTTPSSAPVQYGSDNWIGISTGDSCIHAIRES